MPAGGDAEREARSFFIGLLGFREIPKPPELAERGGIWFESGSVQLHLGVEADFHPARRAHPAFIVDELDGLIQRIQQAGFETDTTQPPLDGYKRAHIFDPFGNRIELMEKNKMTTNTFRVTPWESATPPTEELLLAIMTEQGLNPYSWSNGPDDVYSAHKHEYNKVIYVVRGSITFGLPLLKKQIILHAGDRLDLPAGTVHDAQVGADGVVCLEGHVS